MDTIFPIIPAGPRPFYVMLPILLLLLGGMGFLGYTLYGSQRARFVVSPAGLAFQGDVYGKLHPWSTLRLDAARVGDLPAEPRLRPTARRVGTALPGYASGWFTLANGEKALLYLTARDRAVYIPTTAGHALLLSPADPEAFLAAARRAAGAGRG